MKNNITFAQLDYLCMKQAGNLSESEIDLQYRQLYINNNLMKIYQMLDGLQNPWYDKSAVLTVASTDQVFRKDAVVNSGTITACSVSGTTVTITVTSGNFIAGSILSLVLALRTTGALVGQCLARVVTGGTTATATIISGTYTTNYASATHTLMSVEILSYSATTIDVSGIYFKDFLKIYDDNATGTIGAKNRMFKKYEDTQLFGGLALDPIKKDIAWHQRGDTIELFVPSTANALGTVTGEYRGKPAFYTDATASNMVDIPPEQNRMLIDETVASYLIDIGKELPVDLVGRHDSYNKMYTSTEANKVKALEIRNK
jgi:hypothetical protein